MAVETFVKISQKCRKKFIMVQVGRGGGGLHRHWHVALLPFGFSMGCLHLRAHKGACFRARARACVRACVRACAIQCSLGEAVGRLTRSFLVLNFRRERRCRWWRNCSATSG
jgi:hypothetical protein